MDLFKNGVGRPSNETLKRRKIFGFLVAAVVLLTVGFAALSVTLRINGTARMEGRYSIHFENYDSNGVLATNTGYATSVAPIINQDKTELNNFEVVFNAPGDSVEFKFRIVNDGNINGKIQSITFNDGTIQGEVGESVASLKNYVTREIKYENGSALAVDDVMAPLDNKVVTLTYYFDRSKELEELNLAQPLVINNLSVTIVYVQADNVTTTQAQINPGNEPGDNGSGNVQALTYPLAGTLESGLTYSLTSDGKLTLGGVSSLPGGYNYHLTDDIIEDIANDNEGPLYLTIGMIIRREATYQEVIAMFSDEENEDVNAFIENSGLTRSEVIEMAQAAINIVPVTTIEFTDDVQTITLDSNGENKFDNLSPTTIIVSQTATIQNGETNSDITVQRRSN